MKTPEPIRLQKVRELVAIAPKASLLEFEISGVNSYLLKSKSELRKDAGRHGRSLATQLGEAAGVLLPQYRKQDSHTRQVLEFKKRFNEIESKRNSSQITHQQAGHEFEALIRDLLNFHGWQARKITIPGESSDFTAMYQGNHIVGEVKWHDNPMNGEKVRSLAAKLAPRSASIGLMISYNGFNEGAMNEVRRQIVAGSAVVFFDGTDLDSIFNKLGNPGYVFSEKLRNVYDYLLENSPSNSGSIPSTE